MNFWNIDDLQIRLETNEVSEEEKFLYFFWTSVSVVAAVWIIASNGQIKSIAEHIEHATGLIFVIGGFSYARKKYQPKKFLIERLLCLSFPIQIRSLAYMSPFYFLISVCEEMKLIPESPYLWLIVTLGGELYYYGCLSSYLGRFKNDTQTSLSVNSD